MQAFHGRTGKQVKEALNDPEPRVRLEAVTAARLSGDGEMAEALIALANQEQDRIVYYATWGGLSDLLALSERKALLKDERPQVRLAAFLGLLETDDLTDEEIKPFTEDSHQPLAELAVKRLGGKHKFEHRGRPLLATGDGRAEESAQPLVIPFSSISASTGREYKAAVLRPGVPYYTDRDYRVTKVPPELMGLTFL